MQTQQNQGFETLSQSLNARIKQPAKKRIYIAGKVTGIPYQQAKANFQNAKIILEATGWEVINPLEHIEQHEDWDKAMRIAITQMLTCDAIYLLRNYKQSEGAMLEAMIAAKIQMEVIKD